MCLRLAIAFVLLLQGPMALAAACCGGTSSLPSLISGDDRHQISVGVSHSSIIGDVPVQGLPVFRSASTGDTTTSTRINAATLLSDRLQAGLEWSVVEHEAWGRAGSAKYSGMGDPALSLAYEAWPEWEYSEYKPRGYWFAQVSLPFARSIYDSARADLMDAVGSGLARVATGVLLLKTRGDWDFTLLPEIHRTLPRSFGSADGSVLRVDGGTGASLMASAGYSFPASAWRAGLRLQPVWNSANRVDLERASAKSVCNTGLDLSYLWSDEFSMTAAYTDQTLLGPATNTTLSRVASLQLLKRWPR